MDSQPQQQRRELSTRPAMTDDGSSGSSRYEDRSASQRGRRHRR